MYVVSVSFVHYLNFKKYSPLSDIRENCQLATISQLGGVGRFKGVEPNKK